MSTHWRKVKAWHRANGSRLIPQFHLKANAAWRARKRWHREHRTK
jgi:hypothetical protein